jgi:hypothetical protein
VLRGATSLILTLLVLSSTAGMCLAATIDLEAYRFDPAVSLPMIGDDLTARAQDYAEYGYFLVQTNQPATDSWKDALASSGAVIYGYVSEQAFLVGLDAAGQARVRTLPSTAWIGPFHPAYKISPIIGLQEFRTPERLQDPNLLLMVRVFRNQEGVAARLTELGCVIRDRTDDGFSRRLVVSAAPPTLHAIARIPDVWWIEEKPEFFTQNNVTKWVIQSNSSGYTPIWDHGIHGDGQLATIMDTGVDYNACWFRDTGNAPPGPTHRKIIDYTLYGGTLYDGCDDGHGSHVSGTMLGDQSFINPGNYNYNGMAYKAKLTVQDVGGDDWSACSLGSVAVPSSLTSAFNASYNLGARLHTNSWGSTSNAYDGYCVDLDNMMWQHKDYIVCFAAGNSGPNGSTVGSPGTAKDCVTVGSTQQAPNQETMASYSSRGPASDGRMKPTVTAPGGEDPVFISSVDNNTGNPPSPTCQVASSPFQGTSMATPAVSGSALDIRQYFVDGFYPNGQAGGASVIPSAALIKSMLIASTKDMGSADIPNNNEGWGRILLDNSMFFEGDTRELMTDDVSPGLGTGGTWSRDFTIDSSAERLVVSVVWTDYPATSGSGTRLINDLDLVVTAPDGTQYKGNVFSGGQSAAGGSADRLNVEEGVRINAPATGAWTALVRGNNVPQGPQPFAMVINGSFANWPQGSVGVADTERAPRQAFIRAFPNPVQTTTSLHYSVPSGYEGPVRVDIIDVQGRVLRTLVNKGQISGDYRVTWEGLDAVGRPVADGVYFARMTAGATMTPCKVIVRR